MPPLFHSSASEADDLSHADSDSDDSVITCHDPIKSEPIIQDTIEVLGSGSGSGSGTGKRKATPEFQEDDDEAEEDELTRPFKTPRLSSGRDSDASFIMEPSEPSEPVTTMPALNPSAISYREQMFAPPAPQAGPPQTTLELFRRTFPHLQVPERVHRPVKWLCEQPIKRVPVTTPAFNDRKQQNFPAYLMQACGDEVPPDQACERCSKHNGALLEACIVVREDLVMESTGGACANCWYSRQGSTCTLQKKPPRFPDRYPYPSADKKHPRSSLSGSGSVPTPAAPREQLPSLRTPAAAAERVQPPPPPPPATPSIVEFLQQVQAASAQALSPAGAGAASIHPAYTASLAAAQNTGSSSRPLSLPQLTADDHVAVWENRFKKLDQDSLLKEFSHLHELQDDLNTRLKAMHRVIADRLKAGNPR
ncbi:hypothetical protein QBC35DRAFT_46719 [Podospora australis]|uniref:Uncharacterized protein n=1 Tax=Podospora australis TaxID=1536484 RepID=A0AAN6WM84_9PEZI|nr:hypothetical protein QBC35DRAFT_46719 [Podospora australis]